MLFIGIFIFVSIFLGTSIFNNLFTPSNWRFLVGLKISTFWLPIIVATIILIYCIRHYQIKLILIAVLGWALISASFGVVSIYLIKDIIDGPKNYYGNCEVIYERSRYISFYKIFLKDQEDKPFLLLNSHYYYDLKGDLLHRSPFATYECNKEVNVNYLEYSGVALEVN